MSIRYISVILVMVAGACAKLVSKQPEINSLRLPNNTKPISYNLHIITNHQGDEIFSGTVTIRLKANEDTDYIVVHAHYLEVLKLSLIDQETGSEFDNIIFNLDLSKQFLVIFSRAEPFQLFQGKEYLLSVSFKGNLFRKIVGFFASYYANADGERVWIAATHFQPTYARYAFPCYDEPMLKAVFKIAITHSSNYTALSNMPVDGKPNTSEDGMTTTKFKESPLMSTYIVAFVVANYESIRLEAGNITHRVFSPPISKSKGEFVLKITSETINRLQDEFGIQYSLAKLDQISVPTYPATGMENWGLIIYKRGNILPYSNTSKYYNLQTATLVAHETAHQWLGNLITPKWWNYVWLSEGLSTYYSFKVVDALYPEWNTIDYMLFSEFYGLWTETEERPLSLYVEDEDDVITPFQKISYIKGFYVIRMLEHAIGEDTLKKGIKQYLQKHKYATVDEDDFFDSIQAAATEDNVPIFQKKGQVQKVMKSWTQQSGIPCITVTRNYENGTFQLLQDSSNETFWWIPISFATSSQPDFNNTKMDVLFPNERSILVNPNLLNRTLNKNDWLILNKQQIGMYRVLYDAENYELIIEALRRDPKAIHNYNKAQLIRDAACCDTQSLISSKTVLKLLSTLEFEDDILPWYQGIKVLTRIYSEINDTDEVQYFKYFAQKITSNIYKKIGNEHQLDDTPLTEEFRVELLQFACIVGLENCTSLMEEKLERFINDAGNNDPLMKEFVFCEFLKQSNETERIEFIQRLISGELSSFDEGRTHMMKLVKCADSREFIWRLLSYLGVSIEEIMYAVKIENL